MKYKCNSVEYLETAFLEGLITEILFTLRLYN